MNISALATKISNIVSRKESSRKTLMETMPKNAICAEIGVWEGEFSQEILVKLTPKKLYLIDPWKFMPEYKERWYGGGIAKSQADMDGIYKSVKKLFADRKHVILKRKPSSKAVRDFRNNYFDWVYIDGNHSYDHVKEDLELYLPKIKKGGYLAGDDYLSPWGLLNNYEVKRAVDNFARENNVTFAQRNSQFVLQKL